MLNSLLLITFLSDSKEQLPGTALVATVEGTSTILLEIQALTTRSYYNMPRRVANGIDFNRLNMVIAVLEKRCNLSLGTQDIYVNVIGGIKVDEPAVDLAIAMAIVSNYKNKIIDSKTVFIGELGLTGEVRSVNNIDKRVKEIVKMGYTNIIGNKKQLDNLKDEYKGKNVNLKGISTVDEAIAYILK